MKKGTIVKCLSTGDKSWITVGHLYVVQYEHRVYSEWINIREDTGYVQDYPKQLFKIILEP